MKSLLILGMAVLTSSALYAEEAKKADDSKDTGVTKKEEVKPYKLDTCIVSDEKLGDMGDAVVMVYQGQEIKFCCKKCKPKFEKDPAKYLKKLDEKK